MKQAFIRADASAGIGSGHVMRCLTLAEDLVKRGMEVFFITQDLPGNMAQYIERKGYPVVLLPSFKNNPSESELKYTTDHWQEDAEDTKQCIVEHKFDESEVVLVVDHYALDAKWERDLRSVVSEIMVIDDLANRPYDCDTLLDQNYYQDMYSRYQGLVSTHCKLLLGPKYALLRSEFHEAKQKLRQRDGVVRRILVFFGGSDPTNETLKALEAIELMNRPDIEIDVVVGSSNPRRAEIETICNSLPSACFHCQVENMAELIAGADLAIGAGGSVTWERCFLGLPTLVITVAENQVETIRDLAKTGAIWYLGESEAVDTNQLTGAIEKARMDSQRMIEMGRKCCALFEE